MLYLINAVVFIVGYTLLFRSFQSMRKDDAKNSLGDRLLRDRLRKVSHASNGNGRSLH